MPTYNYRCSACGAEFERVQRISEDAIKECLKCGKPAASRLIIHGNFILKGGGWYSDLYAGSSNKKPGSSTESSSSSSSSISSTSSSSSSSTSSSSSASTSATSS